MKDIPLDPTARGKIALPPGMAVEDIDDFNRMVSFKEDMKGIYVTDKLKANHMIMLRLYYSSNQTRTKFGAEDDLLWPGGHLIRELGFYQAMDHVSSGKGYDTESKVSCFFDYSSNKVLNQNFLRFASIWPLILQARQFDFWSAVLSVVIIVLDVFSFWANKFWKWIQYWLSRFVKWSIARFSNRKARSFLHTFMSTISTRFNCSNFLTDKASVKVMRGFMIESDIRLNRSRIEGFHPIPCVYGPWWKSRVVFVLSGVEYRIQLQSGHLDGINSTVFLTGPGASLKDSGWTAEDMAYFLGVCTLCESLRVPPLKALDEHNGHCCSLLDIFHGVKRRRFVSCQFKKKEKLFIS